MEDGIFNENINIPRTAQGVKLFVEHPPEQCWCIPKTQKSCCGRSRGSISSKFLQETWVDKG